MLFVELFATDPSMVGLAWFDFYSIGHFCFGIGVFLFFSLFYTLPKHKGKIPIFSLLFVFILTLGILILWEALEYFVFIDLGWKFEGRADSWQNMTTDLIIGAFGGIVSWIFCYEIVGKDKNVWAYYIFGIIGFALWLVVFMILRAFTIT
ncbi:MAG: hypothetical protein HWN79_08895 [Candidatus Lokiarchaeota archaeon]|nr:hypothetical protein [Candidatus Lokiarchaeota archaeon]